MAIELRYYVRIDVNMNKTKNSDNLDNKLDNLLYCNEIKDINIFLGNSACWPYIEFWCDSFDLAKKYNELFLLQLKKHKIKTIKGISFF